MKRVRFNWTSTCQESHESRVVVLERKVDLPSFFRRFPVLSVWNAAQKGAIWFRGAIYQNRLFPDHRHGPGHLYRARRFNRALTGANQAHRGRAETPGCARP